MLDKVKRYKTRLVCIWIGLIFFVVFKYLPMLGLIISFENYVPGHGFFDGPWIGFDHFRTFFTNPDFRQVLFNTIIISLYRLLFGFFPPILFAISLNEIAFPWLKRLIQSLSYLPHFLSWVIIYGIAFAFLSEGSGLINTWLKNLNIETFAFLNSEDWFRSIIVGSDLWKDIGWGTIIYMAAIAGINPALYESAVMDGAGVTRKMWHITLPGMAPVIVMLLIIRLGHILEGGLEQIQVFSNPLVYSVGDIIDTWTYRVGILQGRFSLSTAVGLFKSFIGLILVIVANRTAKKVNGSGIW